MRYLKLSIINVEPLCISDDSTSQSGQTNCYRYIPGTTIRGFVVNRLASDEILFGQYKKDLFSDRIAFMNGYPKSGDNELIPSLKGFYENKKADGAIQNVVINGRFDEGMKRASLGRFCRIDGDTVRYCGIDTGSTMKIKIGRDDQSVFRSEYIVPGYNFTSYIAFSDDIDDNLFNSVKSCFDEKKAVFGNGRSQGYGKCFVTASECEAPEYEKYCDVHDDDKSIYMILLSNTVMRDDDGEYCGLNCDKLAKKLNVEKVLVKQCSTSTVIVHGFNRTLSIKLPTVPMYEQGSVFKLSIEGSLKKDSLVSLMDSGIGERKNEGFGRILFLGSSYEILNRKKEDNVRVGAENVCDDTPTDNELVMIKGIAKNYYRKLIRKAMERRIPSDKSRMHITKSQSGTVLSILEKNRYNSGIGDILSRYFSHAEGKEDNQKIHKERVSIKGFSAEVTDILMNRDICDTLGVTQKQVMGIDVDELITSEEKKQMAVSYVIELIKYENKEG